MGIVSRGIPQHLALDLQSRYGLGCFIETGTLTGRTAGWASLYFKRVFTIEASPRFYNLARKAWGNDGPRHNMAFYLGQSQDLLGGILGMVNEPALIWLDAHWSKDLGCGRPEVVCPVLGELERIKASRFKNVIMIDDARLFTGKRGWPGLEQIRASLGSRWSLRQQDDVLIAEPNGR